MFIDLSFLARLHDLIIAISSDSSSVGTSTVHHDDSLVSLT